MNIKTPGVTENTLLNFINKTIELINTTRF